MTFHVEALCVANQFVSCPGKITPEGGRLAGVFMDLLPCIQDDARLGGDTASEVLPEFVFLAIVVHCAPACIFLVLSRLFPVQADIFNISLFAESIVFNVVGVGDAV
jgi:hypothetical protein